MSIDKEVKGTFEFTPADIAAFEACKEADALGPDRGLVVIEKREMLRREAEYAIERKHLGISNFSTYDEMLDYMDEQYEDMEKEMASARDFMAENRALRDEICLQIYRKQGQN